MVSQVIELSDVQVETERLQKLMARAGVASRRRCEQLILDGRVRVNGRTVDHLGTKVDPISDLIEVDGKLLFKDTSKVYMLLNKPIGYITTVSDNHKRRTVMDIVKETNKARVYPVGRLDQNTEGLLLLTNDGELAYRLTHPRFRIDKTYYVETRGKPNLKQLRSLTEGVLLEDGMTKPAQIEVLELSTNLSRMNITIAEGKKRQIRRMFEHIHNPVVFLKRIKFGPLTLKGVEKTGSMRPLRKEEVKVLYDVVGLKHSDR